MADITTMKCRGLYVAFTEAKVGSNEDVLSINDRSGFQQIFIDTNQELDAASVSVLEERYSWLVDKTEFEFEIEIVGKFNKKWMLKSIGYVDGKAPQKEAEYEAAAHRAWLSVYG